MKRLRGANNPRRAARVCANLPHACCVLFKVRPIDFDWFSFFVDLFGQIIFPELLHFYVLIVVSELVVGELLFLFDGPASSSVTRIQFGRTVGHGGSPVMLCAMC